MNVYVVTAGEYSDYHIVAVFSTREKAERFANKRVKETHKRYGWIESYWVHPYEVDNTAWDDREKYYEMIYNKDGTYKESCETFDCWCCPAVREYNEHYEIDVAVDDLELAKKIAQDRIAEYKYRVEVEEKE